MAIALVDKIEKLADKFAAALLAVQIDRLERRAVHFREAVAARDLAPSAEKEDSRAADRPGKSRGNQEASAWSVKGRERNDARSLPRRKGKKLAARIRNRNAAVVQMVR